MISLVIIFFSVQLIFAIYLWINQLKAKSYNVLSSAQKTTIIIPFKNEADRISPLINSINESAKTHKKSDLFSHFQFIFIDDYSTDNTVDLILDQLDVSFELIKLRTTSGKKHAIKHGVNKAIFDRILTLDADVSFSVDFLSHIAKTPCDGLTILSVKMKGKSFFNQLFCIEFEFLQQLTFGLAGSLSNGANLLFTKSAYLKTLEIRQDFNIKSGDDIFLLKAIKQLGLRILAIRNQNLTVTTPAPDSFKQLIQQRKRWITKMNDLPSVLGGVFILMSNLFLGLSVYSILKGDVLFFIPILMKLLSEVISVKSVQNKLLVILHQLYYPFYLGILLLSLPFNSTEKKWD